MDGFTRPPGLNHDSGCARMPGCFTRAPIGGGHDRRKRAQCADQLAGGWSALRIEQPLGGEAGLEGEQE